MSFQPPPYPTNHRLLGVAATIAVHLALLAGWLVAREVEPDNDGVPAEAMQWVDIRPRKVAPVKAPPVRQAETQVPSKPATPAKSAAPRVTVASVADPAPAQAPQPVAQQAQQQQAAREPAAASPAPKSADDIMQQARRDIGKINKELKQQYPARTIRAPIDTAQKRLVRGIELAHELAPPKWYQPAKVKELIDPGGYGRKRYRVTTSMGTYCMTYESNHSPDGRDPMTRSTAPKLTNCDTDQPATVQEWTTQ